MIRFSLVVNGISEGKLAGCHCTAKGGRLPRLCKATGCGDSSKPHVHCYRHKSIDKPFSHCYTHMPKVIAYRRNDVLMQTPKAGSNWFFVDESGDPTFYDRNGNLMVGQQGCSPILLLGFIETSDPVVLRRGLLDLQQQIAADPYFEGVPSLAKTALAFHAKDDLPEVRFQVYKLLATLDFKAQFIVARKVERVFRNNFSAREMAFYDHLVATLFMNTLHRYQSNYIYFAKRGSRNRQKPLEAAIQRSINEFEQKWDVKVNTEVHVQSQSPIGEPCLSIIDYMNWAVYRAFTQREMRYLRPVAEKISLLVDLYDQERYPNNWYSRKNPFDVNKITPL